MKTWAAMVSVVLVLLSAGIAQSQTAMPRQGSPGGARVAPRRPVSARLPVAAQPPGLVQHSGVSRRPGFAQHPGFVQHAGSPRQPFVARSHGFDRSARFPFRSGFATSQIFFAGGGVVAPWPYWYNYPSPAYAPQQYWAYCQDPEGYYPYVQECPGGWVPVAPTPPAPEWWGSSPGTDEQPMGGTSTEEIRAQIARSRVESSGRLDMSLETAAGSRPSP
jgi:hypothetical protein